MAIPYSLDDINAACRAVLKRNGLGKAYLRPVAWRGLGGFGVSAETPSDVAVAAWQMGAYLGEGVREQGIDACVSSWQRMAPNTIDRKSTRLNSSHECAPRMPASACKKKTHH